MAEATGCLSGRRCADPLGTCTGERFNLKIGFGRRSAEFYTPAVMAEKYFKLHLIFRVQSRDPVLLTLAIGLSPLIETMLKVNIYFFIFGHNGLNSFSVSNQYSLIGYLIMN
jgi:hypothetical protein